MKVGYSKKCTICNSKYRTLIEKWANEEGLSARDIATRLTDDYGLDIGHKPVWRHLKQHFNLDAEVAGRYEDEPDVTPPEEGSDAHEQYIKSKAQMDRMAEKRLKDITLLDEIAEKNHALHMKTEKKLTELVEEAKKKGEAPKIPKSLVDLHSTTASETRQALKSKLEILKVDSPQKNGEEIKATLVDLLLSLGD